MPNMQGKICLITGGTNGIGKITALELARMGAAVVIVGRNAEKTAQVVAEIRAATGNQNVDSLLADLSSQQEIRRLASEFTGKYARLDILINNAGAVFMERQLSVDGIEMTFAVNHLAYFLLTNLLLEMLKASAPARIINVSSNAHTHAKIEFDNLQGERSYSSRAYGNSKLANILFTIELARRLAGMGVTANVLHPGFVNTGFGKNNSGFLFKILGAVVPLVAHSPEKGAETSIYLASSADVQNVTGKYFVDSKVAQAAPQASDSAIARTLWDVSSAMVKLSEALPA